MTRWAGRAGRAGRADRGLSLLELLVALTLIAAISALAFGQLSFGLAAWQRQTAAAGTPAPGLVAERLRSLLEDARLTPLRGAHFGRRIAIRGARDQLLFLHAGRHFEPGLTLWRLRIEGRPPALRLIGERRAILSPDAIFRAQDWGAPVFVLDGLDAAAFAFAGPGHDQGRPEWQGTWTDPTTAPALLRLDFSRHGRRWSLRARPEIGQ